MTRVHDDGMTGAIIGPWHSCHRPVIRQAYRDRQTFQGET